MLPQSSKPKRLEIEPVREDRLASVARFLAVWHASYAEDEQERTHRSVDPWKIERQLDWRLVQNPARLPDAELGYCVRTEDGEIVGTLLVFPTRFLLGKRPLTGLCSSCFFVKPEARLQALLMFKKYLAMPRYDFYFGTTCSPYSGKLWQKLRGSAVADSQFEYIVPLRTATLLEALANSKHVHRNWMTLARIIGHGIDTLRTVSVKKSSRLMVEVTQDWERIAELSRRHQDANRVTNERSASFLKWRYERSTAASPHQVHRFKDRSGNEGWFALAQVPRGRRGQVRGTLLLDCIWPRQKIKLSHILALAAELSASNADALFLNTRPGVRYADLGRMTFRRKLEGPQCFILASKFADTIPEKLVDFVPGDGDNAD